MALPSLFGGSKPQDSYFLSLYIGDSFVQAALWGIKHSQVEIISQSESHAYTSQKEVTAKTDAALQELSEESEKTNKVVFGFDPSWIKQNTVVEARKGLVKAITTDLGLEPLGFVSTSESLIQQLMSTEILLSAVVLFFHQDLVSLFLIRKSKLIAYVDSPRGEDVIADVKEGLTRLVKQAGGDEYLPSRVLLVKASIYDTQLTEQQPQLVAYDFSNDQRFIEKPVCEVLPIDTVLEAVTKQGGLAVAKLNGLVVTTAPTQSFQLDGRAINNGIGQSSQVGDSADFSDAQIEPSPTNQTFASSFGIPIASKAVLGVDDEADEVFAEKREDEFVPIVVKKHPSKKGVVIAGIIVGLITVVGGGIAALWYLYQIQVSLVLASLPISDEVKITLDPSASASDPERLLLKAQLVNKELSDTLTQETTGVKLVGDKAKGTVVLYNKTSSAKTFAKDTILHVDALKFALAEEVQVASASVSENSGGDGEKREYGKKEVNVVAVDIGAQSNIAKDAQMKVANFDTNTYAALAKDVFSGGSSREVRVVSADDHLKLQKELSESLAKKAAAAFKAESVDGKYILPSGKFEKKAAAFDVAVGKEADNISLELTMQFEGVVYAKDDVKPLALAVLGSQVKEGYVLVDEDPEILSSPSLIASTSSKIVLDANISSKIKPVVDAQVIRDELRGVTSARAIEYLKQHGEFKSVTITYQPVIAREIFGLLPSDSSRINVEIQE